MCSDREKAKVIVGQRDHREGKGVGTGRVGRALYKNGDACDTADRSGRIDSNDLFMEGSVCHEGR
jgi:hypothetical protein